MEWLKWERLKCPGCGQPRDECMSKDGPQYHAEALRCFACEERDSAREKFTKDEKANKNGLYFVVTPSEG